MPRNHDELQTKLGRALKPRGPDPDFVRRTAESLPLRPRPRTFPWSRVLTVTAGLALVAALGLTLASIVNNPALQAATPSALPTSVAMTDTPVVDQAASGEIASDELYLESVGIVARTELRGLVAPVEATEAGVTITVEELYADPTGTRIVFTLRGFADLPRTGSEDDVGCYQPNSLLASPDQPLTMVAGEGSGGVNEFTHRYHFEPAPAGATTLTLVIPCLPDIAAGAGPQNWLIPLALEPVVADNAYPVFRPNIDVIELQGVRLQLERVIDLGDRYLLELRQTSTRPQLIAQGPVESGFRVVDGRGQTLAARLFSSPLTQNWESIWIETSAVAADASLQVAFDRYLVQLTTAVPFTLDMGPAPTFGSVIEPGLTLDVEGYPVSIHSAEIVGGATASLRLRFEGGPELLAVNWTPSGEPRAPFGLSGSATNAGSSPGITSELELLSLPTGPMQLELSSIILELPGDWRFSLTLPQSFLREPAVSAAPPTSVPPCLDSTRWADPLSVPDQLPAGLTGRVLTSGPPLPNSGYPTLVMSNLDGSEPVVIGSGARGRFAGSPAQVWMQVPTDDQTDPFGIGRWDAESGQIAVVPQLNGFLAFPSPTGRLVAFIDEAWTLKLVTPDGQTVRQLGTFYGAETIDWFSDEQRLLVANRPGQAVILTEVNATTGERISEIDLARQWSDATPQLSPDGEHIAFVDLVTGSIPGLYMANRDGTNVRLVATVTGHIISAKVWSLDGQWLSFTLVSDSGGQVGQPVAVNVGTCEVVRLSGLSGEVVDWWQAP